MVSPTAAGVPVPTTRSSVASAVGGSPTGIGTSGAPAGSVSSSATQGLPAADSSGWVVLVVLVELVAAVLVESPVWLSSTTSAITATTLPTPTTERINRRR